MQPPQLWFAVPGLGRPRPGRRWGRSPADSAPRPSGAPAGRHGRLAVPRLRLPVLGPRLLVGLIAGVLVLLPGLLAAELIVWAYEARISNDAQVRAMAGLDGAAALIDAERTRTLNNADLAGSRLGLLASQGAAPDVLLKSAA